MNGVINQLNGKGKKKKDSPKDLARESRSHRQSCSFNAIYVLLKDLQCSCSLLICSVSFQILAALRNEISVFQSPGPFNTEQEKFVQHFELLQRACIPDHVSYPSYKESTTHACFSTLAMYNYFKDAQRIAKEVKSSFSNDPDRLAELRKLEQRGSRTQQCCSKSHLPVRSSRPAHLRYLRFEPSSISLQLLLSRDLEGCLFLLMISANFETPGLRGI
ncbi:hypothetical protein V6N12_031804, partial [Hibiscus sabdariffa]